MGFRFDIFESLRIPRFKTVFVLDVPLVQKILLQELFFLTGHPKSPASRIFLYGLCRKVFVCACPQEVSDGGKADRVANHLFCNPA